MTLPLYVNWTVHPEIFPSIDWLPIRWYGLLFATAFLAGYYVLEKIFKEDKVPQKWLDQALIYTMIGTIVGARLGHVIFYDLEAYLDDPLEIIMINHGGLASHGAAVGIILALYLFSKRVSKKSILWILDRVVITVALGGVFIRMGNLMNHEIIGLPTDLPWAFLFTRSSENNEVPVHPTQIYEAICYAITFAVLWWSYRKKNALAKEGYIFGLFLIMLWTARFLVEFVKESQGGFESFFNNALSTGQLLSIPFIILGFWLLFRSNKQTPAAA